MSVETFTPTVQVVTMTAPAQRYFAAKLAERPGQIIRFSTKLSGCTGFAYVLDYADQAQDNDIVVAISNDITLAVDKASLQALRHTEIDYVKEGINGIVKFNNPNVLDECGCGESFNVKSAV
ncbi:HesB/IscA family protein [Aliidiomarina maris]|uniref:Fe-S cluster assembly protein SufA/iron-sulfur cluster assembly protein n=1 Tax=Aliidiomarina maris TaxID=531312 RepID=A0A327X213_9GAMM|nr:iron-sulfur cluster assembly accessory protein [Aliidiomarina maris]RAJ96483.1 Fe-S cluster assembly protein SufA/iron-sulfur cluster assembly protein [Aliidiomarina maris]RUO23766.1 iron-sulfur cluster assembly accessory protein [Aliidiomarina maris]